jgi:hypothetical protein
MYNGHAQAFNDESASEVEYRVIDSDDEGLEAPAHNTPVKFLTEQEYYDQVAADKAYADQQELAEQTALFYSYIEGQAGTKIFHEDEGVLSFVPADENVPSIHLHFGLNAVKPWVEVIDPAAAFDIPASESATLSSRSSPVEDVTASGSSTSRTTDSSGSRDRSFAKDWDVTAQKLPAEHTATVFYQPDIVDTHFSCSRQAAQAPMKKIPAFDGVEKAQAGSIKADAETIAKLANTLGF